MNKASSLQALKQKLRDLGDPEKAKILMGFFKTGPGQYGEGDRFLGIKVPVTRGLAKEFSHLSLTDLAILLRSKIHEERLVSALILVKKSAKAGEAELESIARFYLENRAGINNWDLVDTSAEHILGRWLFDKPRDLLFELARSKSLWDRRIAILSTFHFIRRGDFGTTLELAKMLLNDDEDLIHKAVGWMLREVGNRSHKAEEDFLKGHAANMPRTMLRYAIEKFPEPLRKKYLAIKQVRSKGIRARPAPG